MFGKDYYDSEKIDGLYELGRLKSDRRRLWQCVMKSPFKPGEFIANVCIEIFNEETVKPRKRYYLLHSEDGRRWKKAMLPHGAYSYHHFTLIPNESENVVMLSCEKPDGEFIIVYTDDGFTWKEQILNKHPTGMSDIQKIDSRYIIAVRYSTSRHGNERLLYSDDGFNWSNSSISNRRYSLFRLPFSIIERIRNFEIDDRRRIKAEITVSPHIKTIEHKEIIPLSPKSKKRERRKTQDELFEEWAAELENEKKGIIKHKEEEEKEELPTITIKIEPKDGKISIYSRDGINWEFE